MIDYTDLKSYLRVIKRIAPSTIRKKIGIIRFYEDYCTRNNVTLSQGYEGFLHESSDRIQEGQLNNYVKALKSLSSYLIDRNLDSGSSPPLKYFNEPDVYIEPLTREEKDLLLSYKGKMVAKHSIQKNQYIHELYKDFTMAFDMLGMRFEDLAELQVRNVQSNSIVFIQKKTRRTVKIPLEQPLYSVLQRRIRGKQADDLVFPSNNSNKVIRHKYSEWLKEAGETMGVRDFKRRCHPHNFRRSFAQELSEEETDTRLIQELMGHKSITTTAGYIHPNEVQLRKSIKKLPLAQRYCNPVEQIRFIMEAIKSFHLDQDGRFTYSLIESNNELLFRLKVKEEEIDD